MKKIMALCLTLALASVANAGWTNDSDNWESAPWNSNGEAIVGQDGWTKTGWPPDDIVLDTTGGINGSQGVKSAGEGNNSSYAFGYRNSDVTYDTGVVTLSSLFRVPHLVKGVGVGWPDIGAAIGIGDTSYEGWGVGNNLIEVTFYSLQLSDVIQSQIGTLRKTDTGGRVEFRLNSGHGVPAFIDMGWFEGQLVYDTGSSPTSYKVRIRDVKEDGSGYETGSSWWTYDFTGGDTAATWDVESIAIGWYMSALGGETSGDRPNMDDINVTPEPATLVVLGIGGLLALLRRRR